MISYVLRPIRLTDLDDLKALTQGMDNSIASLPNDRAILQQRIEHSLQSFEKKIKSPGKEYYLFALEHIPFRKIVGVSGISGRIGEGTYFFAYERQKEVFEHCPLNVSKTVEVLKLKKIKKGPSELCSLYLSPQFRVHGLGSLLSLGRYLFINAFPNRFDTELIADMKGYRDENGNSPFWEAIGDIFFGGSLSTVDTMKSLGHKSFIRDLMPRHPIYIPLLPVKAQKAIGEVHTTAKPALHLLEKQGFKTGKWFDIFDAGPYAIAKRKNIKLIKNIRHATVTQIIQATSEASLTPFLIANDSIDFRACIGNLSKHPNETVTVNTNVARVLNLKEGSSISYVKH